MLLIWSICYFICRLNRIRRSDGCISNYFRATEFPYDIIFLCSKPLSVFQITQCQWHNKCMLYPQLGKRSLRGLTEVIPQCLLVYLCQAIEVSIKKTGFLVKIWKTPPKYKTMFIREYFIRHIISQSIILAIVLAKLLQQFRPKYLQDYFISCRNHSRNQTT